MNTLGTLASERATEDTNNFLILRLLAASMVIHGHAFAVAAPCASCEDLVQRYVGYRYSGDVGLHIFFAISGFLIFASYAKRGKLGEFVWVRALRLLPAFWACLLLTVLTAAAYTSLPIGRYLRAPGTLWYLVSNGSLYRAEFGLPGVTLTSSAKYGAVVNGSIWSLFVEVRLYFIVALMGATGIVGSRALSNMCLAVLLAIGILAPDRLPFIGEYSENWRLAAFFGAGVFLQVNRYSVPLNGQVAALLLAASVLSKGTPDFDVIAGACLVYGTFYIAYCRKLRLPSLVQDYSYGIYIYGWPAEQVLAHAWPQMGPYRLTAVALCVAWICGFLSWHLIEKHALKLKGVFRGGSKPVAV